MGNRLRLATREIAIAAGLILASVAFSVFMYLTVFATDGATRTADRPSPGQSLADSSQHHPQGMALDRWQPTGSSHVEVADTDLWIHAFRIQPDRISVTYSLAAKTEGKSRTLQILDETGHIYETVSDRVFGSSGDVSTGVITTAPYRGDGKQLVLELVVGSETGTVAFLELTRPGPVDYDTGRGIEPIVQTGGTTFGLASFPGGKSIRVIVERSGEESAFYGYAPDGIARSVSEDEFLQLWEAEERYSFDVNEKPLTWPASTAE